MHLDLIDHKKNKANAILMTQVVKPRLSGSTLL